MICRHIELGMYLIVSIFITPDGDLSGDKHQLKIGNSPIMDKTYWNVCTVIKSIYFEHWHKLG